MDLAVIVVGMAVGGLLFFTIAESIPGLPREAQVALATFGAMLGTVLTYGALWHHKRQNRAAPVKPPRRFLPQIAGSKCARCETTILFVADGSCCPICDKVFCIRCQPSVPCSACKDQDIVLAEVVDSDGKQPPR